MIRPKLTPRLLHAYVLDPLTSIVRDPSGIHARTWPGPLFLIWPSRYLVPGVQVAWLNGLPLSLVGFVSGAALIRSWMIGLGTDLYLYVATDIGEVLCRISLQ